MPELSRLRTQLPLRRVLLPSLLLLACTPDKGPLPVGVEEGCVISECHAQVEQIHYGGSPLGCVSCHLGDPNAVTKEAGHVTVDDSFNPSTPGGRYMERPSMRELDQLPLDVIQFLNPADYRVAMRSCGDSALGGASCHALIVENSVLLNRATLAGQLAGGAFVSGSGDKTARWGVVRTDDPHVPASLPDGTRPGVDWLPAEPPATVTGSVARAYYVTLEQDCLECHLNQDGPRVPGRYYSSGCSGCHMITTNEARAETADPTQDRGELGHVQTHRLTNLIPDTQCAHCHISHLSRSLLAQGVRERSEPEGDEEIGGHNRGVEDPEHHVPWAKENYDKFEGKLIQYGKPYPFYVEDEDGTNDVDETPPDIHTERGMGCIDCHNIREAHGDRQLAERMDREIDVRCETCHGRPGERGSLAAESGLVFNVSETSVGGSGNNRPVFSVTPSADVLQYGRFTKAQHPVTQITVRTASASATFNPRTQMGCALHAGTAETRAALKRAVNAVAATSSAAVAVQFPGLIAGTTFDVSQPEFAGRLECFACHNQWTVNCYGCHTVRDDRQLYTSRLTGETKPGKVRSFGLSVVADSLAMGFNTRGRISPLVGTSVFFTHIDASGKKVIDAAPLTTGEGLTGEGNVHNPVHHHTVRQEPRDCDGCHPSETGSHDAQALLTAVGLGTGRFVFTDGAGKTHWLDRLVWVDYDGDGTFDDPAARGLPTRVEAVRRAVGTTHSSVVSDGAPEPGPLDLETINRTLMNRVVPQR